MDERVRWAFRIYSGLDATPRSAREIREATDIAYRYMQYREVSPRDAIRLFVYNEGGMPAHRLRFADNFQDRDYFALR